MKLNELPREFPAQIKLSFYKVFEELEKIAGGGDDRRAVYAREVLKELEPFPILKEGFDDARILKKHREQISILLNHLFPSALTLNEIKGAAAPFHFTPFHTSKRFENIIKAAGDDYKVSVDGMNDDMMYIIACTVILQLHYGYSMKINKPFILEIPDKKSNTIRYYRSAYNADLTEVLPTERSIDITHDDYLELMDNFHNIKIWKEKFPPGSWVMRGVGIINLQDVTIDQTLNSITSSLLEKPEGSFDELTKHLRALFGIDDLNVAYMGIENNKFIRPQEKEMNNMLMRDHLEAECDHILCSYNYRHIIRKGKALAISNVDSYYEKSGNLMSKMLKAQGIQSYLISPLIHNDKFVGFLELGSPRKYELTTLSIELLKTIHPILSVAANRYHQEKVNQVEVMIQDKFTSIQQSVKWRFEEEARRLLVAESKGEKLSLRDLAFNDVYPLYGQLDIKDSSVIRNNSIRADLLTQLSDVRQIMQEALKKEPLPVYDEIIFRLENFVNELKDGIMVVSEHLILEFLNDELSPVFEHLKKKNRRVAKMIHEYEQRLHPGVRMIYEKHKEFDESVATLNSTLTHYIDEKQKQAQAMFPHFYERFKTDGVEFNMYIGQSLTKGETYNPLFLRNLQLWQLIVMCEAEIEIQNIRSDLKVPLQVASLILVHNDPLSIHFRIDEKRFDVEGAYNARYEIVKKRIDKAYIKGTKERITVPGKIAIIYSNNQDANEYRKYISYLQAHGYLEEGGVEDHDLEDLQGITGLKALRVKVNFDPEKKAPISVDELISSL